MGDESNLLESFHALRQPSVEGALTLGTRVTEASRLAATSEGHVALAIEVARDGSSVKRELANIRYDPPAALEVHGAGDIRVEHLAVLVCKAASPQLQAAFLRIAQVQLQSSQRPLPEAELERRLNDVVALFRALTQPSQTTVQGLWAELAIIVWSRDPKATATSWHSNPRQLHDFAAGPDRLEVKSRSGGLREHEFRLEQLQDAPGGRTLIASVLVVEDDNGKGVEDLLTAILARTPGNSELRARLQAIVTRSLGDQWQLGASRCFDLEAARQTLALYDARDVPTIPQPVPAEVRDIRFLLDLSSSDQLSLGRARALGASFDAWLPEEAG